jgi:hypothetical protein
VLPCLEGSHTCVGMQRVRQADDDCIDGVALEQRTILSRHGGAPDAARRGAASLRIRVHDGRHPGVVQRCEHADVNLLGDVPISDQPDPQPLHQTARTTMSSGATGIRVSSRLVASRSASTIAGCRDDGGSPTPLRRKARRSPVSHPRGSLAFAIEDNNLSRTANPLLPWRCSTN